MHETLEKMEFPYVLPVIKWEETELWQKWFDKIIHADYRKSTHRMAVYEMLNALHQTNAKVAWYDKLGVKRFSIVEKFRFRLRKFEQLHASVKQYLKNDFESIARRGKETLAYPIMINSSELTLCHGDVAHHNFVMIGNEWKMIDFDLAYVGNPNDELIVWMMRVLPFIKYDIKLLVQEIPELKKLAPSFPLLLFPNEVMREWIHFSTLNLRDRKKLLPYLKELTNNFFIYEKKLEKDIESFLI